ncbi:ribonuclease III [Erythrobacter arachoides]|uniref:Ribonuclease 3 n=1 Tax=Aurantiacibacter arachoides TaxID=1850444 RepID=A0A845A0G3_9SPHN|nr:ribonuclease III [Aurantiacibacter arachoides]MXO92962.1 ribonuclease III [Aurantiacibacter arachoides]GGD53128.1 ribonuclease 3 [Aurantiacibacter arachoides]
MTGLSSETRTWLKSRGFTVREEAMWREALTHGSTGEARDYQRLEFLGDRVLGLTIAHWLFQRSAATEGKMAQRLNALVSKTSCAERARELGVAAHARMGKQARDDGAQDSDNVLGDIMESLLGANFLDAGFDATRDLIHQVWKGEIEGSAGQSKHPKSALQEWAAGNQRRPPEYRVLRTEGPDHARTFVVEVAVHKVGALEASAGGKQEAETEAARLFMEKYG